MTDTEKLFPDADINPRWALCKRALGRRPKAWEFMIWNTDQVRAFLDAHHGKPKDLRGLIYEYGSMEAVHEAYDAWLTDRVEKLT